MFLRPYADHIAVLRLKRNEPLTPTDLKELQRKMRRDLRHELLLIRISADKTRSSDSQVTIAASVTLLIGAQSAATLGKTFRISTMDNLLGVALIDGSLTIL